MHAAEILSDPWNAVAANLDPFGALGLALGFAAGLMPGRVLILVVSAACTACFGLHFLRLGAWTGTAMCAVSVVQSLTAARFPAGPRRSRSLLAAFAASSIAALWLTAATWSGWPSALAGAGALLATAARLQAGSEPMRKLFLGASSCWAGHNLLVGSAFGLTCDVLTIAALMIALRRVGSAPGRVGAKPLAA